MGAFLKQPFWLCFLCLFFAGCKINVSVLGHGSVRSVTEDIPVCASEPEDLCLNAGYNQRIELVAEPADGYEFAGWAGDCEGTSTCAVNALGSRHLVAVFKTSDDTLEAQTSMRYLDNFLFSGPWPSDLRRNADGTLNLKAFPVDDSRFASSARQLAASQKGFARNGAIYFPLHFQDPGTLKQVVEQDYLTETHFIQLINLESSSPDYLKRTPTNVQVFQHPDPTLGTLLRVEPEPGHTLAAAAEYAAIVMTGYGLEDITNLAAGPEMKKLIQGEVSGPHHEQWLRIKTYLEENTPYDADNVIAFTLFTTQPETDRYDKARDFLSNVEIDLHNKLNAVAGTFTQNCASRTADSDGVMLKEYRYPLPNVLTGKPPYLTSGGQLNLDVDGALQEKGYPVETQFVVSVPCALPPPGEQYPVEFHSLPSQNSIADYWEYFLYWDKPHHSDNNKVIRIYIASPHTEGRHYMGGYQFASLLETFTNITSQQLAGSLGDFNPFNIKVNETQYLQYAIDLLVIKKLFSEMADAVDYIAESRPDLNDISLIGTSLGAITSLHANAIDPTHTNLVLVAMPRYHSSHINGVWDYLGRFVGESGQFALASLLGIHPPFNDADPLLALLQSGIDTLDPNNLVASARHQNLMIMMADIEDPLHGGDASYQFLTAVHQTLGLTLIVPPEWGYMYSHPFLNFVETEEVNPYERISEYPIRIATPAFGGDDNLHSFSTQMRSGNGFQFDPAN